jgi:hypothetical protein
MNLKIIRKEEHNSWDRFVDQTKGGTLFHTSWWHQAWKTHPDIYARKGDSGDFEAGIPIHRSSSRRFTSIGRPPLSPINGPVFKYPSNYSRADLNKHIKKELFEAIFACPRADYIEFALSNEINDIMPFIWSGFDTHVAYTYIIPKSESEFWTKNMSKRHKINLNQARKEMLDFRCTIQINPPFNLIQPLLSDTAKIKGFRYFGKTESWWNTVFKKGVGRIYLIRNSEMDPICTTVMVWDSHTAYYLLGGMNYKVRKDTALNWILFERMIHDAHEMNLDFNFEGSILQGVERFFRGWGGELRPMYRLIKIPSLRFYCKWSLNNYLKRHRLRKIDAIAEQSGILI